MLAAAAWQDQEKNTAAAADCPQQELKGPAGQLLAGVRIVAAAAH
jgi:hypothetical protein